MRLGNAIDPTCISLLAERAGINGNLAFNVLQSTHLEQLHVRVKAGRCGTELIRE